VGRKLQGNFLPDLLSTFDNPVDFQIHKALRKNKQETTPYPVRNKPDRTVNLYNLTIDLGEEAQK
jgi:hypothetical protein